MMKKTQWILLAVMGLCLSASAEMRVWTGEDGKLFEGEFKRELLGRIQVKDSKGTLRLIPLDKVSIADMNYLKKQVVPDVDITVRKDFRGKPEMEWTIPNDKTTLFTFDVKLEKKSKMDCSAKLTAELYVIAEEVDGDNWVLVHREAKKFVFPEGRDSAYSFAIDKIGCRRYFSAWAEGASTIWRGWEYLGYIVVLIDQKGQVAAHKTDLGNENWMEQGLPVVVERLRKLAVDGRGSVYSRHFNSKIEKSAVPQLPWYKRTKNF